MRNGESLISGPSYSNPHLYEAKKKDREAHSTAVSIHLVWTYDIIDKSNMRMARVKVKDVVCELRGYLG